MTYTALIFSFPVQVLYDFSCMWIHGLHIITLVKLWTQSTYTVFQHSSGGPAYVFISRGENSWENGYTAMGLLRLIVSCKFLGLYVYVWYNIMYSVASMFNVVVLSLLLCDFVSGWTTDFTFSMAMPSYAYFAIQFQVRAWYRCYWYTLWVLLYLLLCIYVDVV